MFSPDVQKVCKSAFREFFFASAHCGCIWANIPAVPSVYIEHLSSYRIDD